MFGGSINTGGIRRVTTRIPTMVRETRAVAQSTARENATAQPPGTAGDQAGGTGVGVGGAWLLIGALALVVLLARKRK